MELQKYETGVENESPCPVCGGTSYSWGIFQGHFLTYKEQDGTALLGDKFSARRCNVCGNIQWFGGSSDIQEYRRILPILFLIFAFVILASIFLAWWVLG